MNQDILVTIEHIRGKVSDISYMMLAAGRVIAGHTGGHLVALLFGSNQQHLADDLAADAVWYIDHPTLADFAPDTYLDLLAAQIGRANPRAVLFGHSSIGMDVASGLSVRLNLPLITQCQKVVPANGSLQYVCQICGGKLMAEGFLPEPTALLTLVPGAYNPDQGRSAVTPQIIPQEAVSIEQPRIQLLNYIEPDSGDVDVSRESILIAVGRGLTNQDDLELVQDLADSMGGAVCGSRPIVDQGWLPSSLLIGKSGQIVKPKLYLALGISGAPEHVEGFSGADLIIAINTDPSAPIFDVAQFGADVDMLDFVEEMIDQLEISPVV